MLSGQEDSGAAQKRLGGREDEPCQGIERWRKQPAEVGKVQMEPLEVFADGFWRVGCYERWLEKEKLDPKFFERPIKLPQNLLNYAKWMSSVCHGRSVNYSVWSFLSFGGSRKPTPSAGYGPSEEVSNEIQRLGCSSKAIRASKENMLWVKNWSIHRIQRVEGLLCIARGVI